MPALRRRFAGAAPRPREVSALEARSRSSVGLPVERLPASALSVALLPGCVGERGEISIFDGKRDNALATVRCYWPAGVSFLFEHRFLFRPSPPSPAFGQTPPSAHTHSHPLEAECVFLYLNHISR